MRAAEGRRAREAAMATASALGLAVDDADVLSDSNRMIIRLRPCDVVARIAPLGYAVFSAAEGEREIDIVRRLGEADGPVAPLAPGIEPRLHVRDGFEIGLWTYCEPLPPRELPAADYARALEHLHRSMARVDVETPHFTDRIADVERWVARRDETPDLADEDRDLLLRTLGSLRRSIVDRGAKEQLLHGEPHPWNLLDTSDGPRFIDFENVVQGPVEFDLAWVPTEVSDCYPGVDPDLLDECRGVVVAIIAAHRWRQGDDHPAGRESGVAFLERVRAGAPWHWLDGE